MGIRDGGQGVPRTVPRMARDYARGELNQSDVQKSLLGWLGYARFADSYNFRRRLFAGFRLKRDK
jgi:hypothetical protein